MNEAARRLPVDPLGTLLAAVGTASLIFLPFVVLKANRILPGDGRSLSVVLSSAGALGFYAGMTLIAWLAIRSRDARVRLAGALTGIAVVLVVIGIAAATLTPPGNRVVRVAPGAGFWLLFIVLGLFATDSLTRLQLGPRWRVASLFLFLCVAALVLGSGAFDHLSIMREYAVNAERFTREVRQHLLLALGSLAAATVVGLPLGVFCHRVPRIRTSVLAVLNLIQTIPSIALFGILMAPLAALASAYPRLAELGIRGIGTAPALLALFLYSLLPVTANTVIGIERVSPAAVDAGRGMGMTNWQLLKDVELILAFPVILTGIRIVLVQNIGLVTVAALIGGGGLGVFVFQGIGQTAIDLVLLGTIPIVVLAFSSAVVLDAVIAMLTRTRT
jgi:osmoprotectant transport system permease protein